MRRSEAECAALAAQAKSSGPTTASGRPAFGFRSGIGKIQGGCFRLASLIQQVSRGLDRVIVDRTGLEGRFDYELAWTPDTFQLTQLNQGVATGSAASASPADGPSQLTALTEQLGLRLESSRASIDVIVIDDAELPRPD